GEVFTFISSTGDFDVIDNTEFLREDEKKDERVGRIVELINAKQDWTHFDWEVESLPAHMDLSDSEQDEPADVAEEPSVVAEEPTVVAGEPAVAAKRGKRKLIDPGVDTGPPAAKGKGKASANVDPLPVRRRLRPDVQTDENEMIDFLKNLTKSSRCVDKGTQDSLQETMGNLSQASYVKSFDPSQHLDGDEPADFATPLSSFKPADWRPPTLKDVDSHEDHIHDPDYSLVFVPEELWAKLVDWTKTFK
ncbi:hypothetical protein HID58_066426, partial [Brassica napus]